MKQSDTEEISKILSISLKVVQMTLSEKELIDNSTILYINKLMNDYNHSIIPNKNEDTCKHINSSSGHSPYVAPTCDDCGEEI